jgi:hypothetical protein
VMPPASGPAKASPAVTHPPDANPVTTSTRTDSSERTEPVPYRTSLSLAVAVIGPGLGAGGA